MTQNKGNVKVRVSLLGIFIFCMIAIIVGIIGMGLPPTINLINGFDKEATYGYFASYAVSGILFWLLIKRVNLTCKRKSYIEQIGRFSQKLCTKLRESKRRKSK